MPSARARLQTNRLYRRRDGLGQKVPLSDIWRIKQMIHGYGLRYHKEKTFVDRPAEITGVIVRGDKLAVPHRQHLKRRSAQQELLIGEGDT
jgi:hypothetical protein